MDATIRARSASLRDRWSFVFGAGIAAVAAATLFFVVSGPSVTSAATSPPIPGSAAERGDRIPADHVDVEPAAAAPALPGFLSFAADKKVESDRPPVFLIPSGEASSKSTEAPPVVTMLHGMCHSVEWSCEAVRATLPEGHIMTCPTGNGVCEAGWPDWTDADQPEKRAKFVADSVDAALASLDIPAGRKGKEVLMGFSRGAFVTRDAAYHSNGRYKGLVFIGAVVSPDPAKLKANGIKRVVFASGDLDMAAGAMRSAHARLLASGIESKYVSLGPVFHTLPDDTAPRLEEAVRWVSE